MLAEGSHGKNSFGRIGYGGPCPPEGPPHTYRTFVFAVDSFLELSSGASDTDLLTAIRGKVLAQGRLDGTYARGGQVTDGPGGQGVPAIGATVYTAGIGVPQERMVLDRDLVLSDGSIIEAGADDTRHLQGQAIEYNTVPPTSGPHWNGAAPCGFYEQGLPDEVVVHNLEHGNVVMSYNLAISGDLQKIRRIHDELTESDQWLVTRFYDKIPFGHVAVTAWGVLEQVAGADEPRIRQFYLTYRGNQLSPETEAVGRGIPC